MTTDALVPGATSAAREHHKLAGKLGPTAIVFMVVAAAAPLTVVAGTFPIGIAAGNGAAFPGSYVVCTAVLLLFAVGFTAMARHIRGAGAFYTYVANGFGRHVGLGAAFLALLSYTAVQVGVYGYVGAAINDLVTSHGGPVVPWYLYALVMMGVVATLGYRHIELSG
jgi:amino acid transporter